MSWQHRDSSFKNSSNLRGALYGVWERAQEQGEQWGRGGGGGGGPPPFFPPPTRGGGGGGGGGGGLPLLSSLHIHWRKEGGWGEGERVEVEHACAG